jgi:hypothetical protein
MFYKISIKYDVTKEINIIKLDDEITELAFINNGQWLSCDIGPMNWWLFEQTKRSNTFVFPDYDTIKLFISKLSKLFTVSDIIIILNNGLQHNLKTDMF